MSRVRYKDSVIGICVMGWLCELIGVEEGVSWGTAGGNSGGELCIWSIGWDCGSERATRRRESVC